MGTLPIPTSLGLGLGTRHLCTRVTSVLGLPLYLDTLVLGLPLYLDTLVLGLPLY